MALYGTGHAELRTETAAHTLIVEDGRVVGAEATDAAGQTILIRARRGVLLAAGGIEGNAGLRTENGTPGRAEWSMGPRGRTPATC